MQQEDLARLQHPATVPKSLRECPPALLAVQLAGAEYYASLSHAIVAARPTTPGTSDEGVESLARRALCQPLQRALAAHYGAHALRRGCQKPLGPCFRSRKDCLSGSHSGRNRALWRQSKRGPARRRWCARCGLPQEVSATRVRHLPWPLTAGNQRGGRGRVTTRRTLREVCVQCETRAATVLSAQNPLPLPVDVGTALLHSALRGITVTTAHRHHRRAPRKHKARREATGKGLARLAVAGQPAQSGRQRRRLAASLASVAPLTPTVATVAATRVPRTTAALERPPPPSAHVTFQASSVSARADGSTTARHGTTPTSAGKSAVAVHASQQMAQLARAVPKGIPAARARPAPGPGRSGGVHSPGGTGRTAPAAPTGKAASTAVPAKAPSGTKPKVVDRRAGTGGSGKVLDVMKSLGF